MIVEAENTGPHFRYQKSITLLSVLHVLRFKMLTAIYFDNEILPL